jgi:hypothetical protein
MSFSHDVRPRVYSLSSTSKWMFVDDKWNARQDMKNKNNLLIHTVVDCSCTEACRRHASYLFMFQGC